jgi:hypothetical protein
MIRITRSPCSRAHSAARFSAQSTFGSPLIAAREAPRHAGPHSA